MRRIICKLLDSENIKDRYSVQFERIIATPEEEIKWKKYDKNFYSLPASSSRASSSKTKASTPTVTEPASSSDNFSSGDGGFSILF